MNRKGCFPFARFILAVPFFCHLLLAPFVSAVPCKGQTVEIGETMDAVSAKCGGPVVKEQWTVKVEEADEKGAASSTVTSVDEWTYDSGLEDLMQTYRFEGGKVVGIANPGYGRTRDLLNDPCGNGESLKVGESPVETYVRCGEPLAREKRPDKVVESENNGKRIRTAFSVVDWTYRYGPNLPGYTITFENGISTNIRTREFGK